MESSPQPPETSRFNLSEWALNHQTLMLFFIVVLAIFGTTSYYRLGQAEDPAFTFRVMVVNVFWPGATAREMEQQVTDRIEKKLQETPGLNYLRSFSKPGEAFIFVSLKDSVDPKTVPNSWYQVRKKIGDIRQSLPEGVIGPFYNDEFGDTYGSIYAFTSDGFSHAELKKKVDFARQVLLRVPDVAKVDLVGVQDEKVFVEMSDTKLATLGLNPQLIIQTLQQQNVMTAAGNVSTQDDRVFLRVTGEFQTLEHIKNIGIRANSRTFRLGDIATITKGYADPPSVRFRYKGQEAIGLAVSMRQGGDIIALGKNLQAEIDRVRKDLPIGVDIHQVSDQPKVVAASVQEFVKTLNEALIIVLVVSFLSLGFRTGTVVALSIPLVLAFVYIAMWVTGIDLQKISLGALIIALGLLVDDAIIAVEMMALKLEQGWDKMRAATYAYTTTAFPMLTGTLITAAGFLPVGLAKSAAGEYTFSIFAVVSIALLASWVVAVMFTPYLGYKLLKLHKVEHEDPNAVYRRGFYVPFRKMVTWCVRYRWVVIVLTALAFIGSLGAFKFVQQQFFPNASRPELIVDLWLPEGSSWQSTEREAKRLEAVLKADPDIENYVAYLGGGSPRFVLVLDQQMPNVNLSEFVIVTKDLKAREAVFQRLNALFATDFAQVRGRVTRLPNGPPVGYPVQFRVSGEDPTKLRELAEQVAKIMRDNPNTRDVNLDWNDKTKVMRLEVDQDKARALGINTQNLSFALRTMLVGSTITQFREDDKLIDVVARVQLADRDNLGEIQNINVYTGNGRFIPLAQIARIHFETEDGVIWRRDRLPTITVRADIPDTIQAPTVSFQIDPKLNELRAKLPPGYRIDLGGAQEESSKAQGSINAVMPLMLVVVITLLMIQLQSFSRMLLVLLTAPLGMIGVTLFLLLFNAPFGFVAMLGVIALAGMIMRNSVILVDQIEQDIKHGSIPWEAIIDSTVRRFRPIMLTAAAAILGMIPLTQSTFWGPMAIAIMGGLLVATVLTLLFLPALYAAWYRVPAPAR